MYENINETLEKIYIIQPILRENAQKYRVLHDEAVTGVLVGASKPSQLLDNIRALENTAFSESEMRKIDSIAAM